MLHFKFWNQDQAPSAIQIRDDDHCKDLIAVAVVGGLQYSIESVMVRLCAYRGADYSAPSEALADGAMYTLIARYDSEKLEDTDAMRQIDTIAARVSSCINSDMSELQLVWLELDGPQVFAYMHDLI